jgi:hypothetical protein
MDYGGNTIDDKDFFRSLNAAVRIALRDCDAKYTDEIKSNAMYAALNALRTFKPENGDTIQRYVFLCAKREAKHTIRRTRNRERITFLDGEDETDADGIPGERVNIREIPQPETSESFDLRVLHPADVILMTETIRIGVIPVTPGIKSAATRHAVITAKRNRLRKLLDEHRKANDDESGD